MPYHVRITQKSQLEHDEVKLDLDEEQLETRFLTPYRDGHPIVIGGKTIPPEDIERIRINYTDETSEKLLPIVRREQERSGIVLVGGPSDEWYVADKGKDVTDEIITGPPGRRMNVKLEKAENIQSDTSNPDPEKYSSYMGEILKLVALFSVSYVQSD